MKSHIRMLVSAAAIATLAACSSTPERVESLETARALVPQVEASPRAGVAASNVAQARKSLDTANRLFDSGGNVEDIDFESSIATLNAQIANEKIMTAQANEEVAKGQAERQAVLVEAREAQAKAASQRAQDLEQQLADLKAKKTDRGMVMTLGDVLFETGKWTLKPAAYRTIDQVAEVLKQDQNRKVLIEGHTDSTGTEEFNQQLSERRAEAVQTALLSRGVASSQITAVGRGQSTPVASNNNPGGRQQNRRVEMIFQDAGGRVASDSD